jgi:hypothetical protein
MAGSCEHRESRPRRTEEERAETFSANDDGGGPQRTMCEQLKVITTKGRDVG